MGQAAQQSVASAAEVPHVHKRGRCGDAEGEDERPAEGEEEDDSTATQGSRGPAPPPRGLDEEPEDAWEAFRAKRVLVDPGHVGDGTGPVLFSLPSPSPSPSSSPAPRTLPDGAHFVIASMLDLRSRLCVCACAASLLDPYRAHMPSLRVRSPPRHHLSLPQASTLVASLLQRHSRLQHLVIGARSLLGLATAIDRGGLQWLHSLTIHAEAGASQRLLLPLLTALAGPRDRGGVVVVGCARLRVLQVQWRVADSVWRALVEALGQREALRLTATGKAHRPQVCKPIEGLSVDWVRAPGAGGGAGRADAEAGEEEEEEEEDWGEGAGTQRQGRVKDAYTFHMYSTTRRLSPSTYLRYGEDSYSGELLEGEGLGRRRRARGAMGDPLCRLLLTSPACAMLLDLHLLAELTPLQAGMVVDFLKRRSRVTPLLPLRRLGLWGDAACGIEDLGGAVIQALLEPHTRLREQEQARGGEKGRGRGEGGLEGLELRGLSLSGGPMEALASFVHSHAHAQQRGHAPPLQLQVLRLQGGSLRACDLRHLLQLPPSPSLGPWSTFFDPPPCPPPLPCLRVLDLGYNSLAAGDHLAALAAALEDGAMPRLEELVLSGNPSLGDEGLGQVVGAMAKAPQHTQHLTILALARCGVTSVGVSLLSGSLYAPHAPGGRVCPRLCTLDLSGNVVGRVGCAALGTAMCKEGGLEGLHSLRLSGAKNVGDEGAKYLLRALTGAQAALGGVGLRQLDLSYCGLGARGMAEVGMAMVAQALPRLQELSLAGNDDKDHEVEEGEILGEGVGAVVRALGKGGGQCLTWLNLAFARLQEDEAMILADVLERGHAPQLRQVLLTGTGVGVGIERRVQDLLRQRSTQGAHAH